MPFRGILLGIAVRKFWECINCDRCVMKGLNNLIINELEINNTVTCNTL